MYLLLIKTEKDLIDYLKKEVSEITNLNVKIKKNLDEYIFLELSDFDEFRSFLKDLVIKGRLLKKIYLIIASFNSIDDNISLKYYKELDKEFYYRLTLCEDSNLERKKTYEKLANLITETYELYKVNLKNYFLNFHILSIVNKNFLCLDLTNTDLNKREYKINVNSNTISSFIPNYCAYLLELNKLQNFSIIDPVANLGEIIIEVSCFNIREKLIRKRESLFLKRLFNIDLYEFNSSLKDKNKYIAVVQNPKNFKKLKENLSYLNSKIKLSMFDLEWLDLKVGEKKVDVAISYIPSNFTIDEFKELIYQLEYIIKSKICLISLKKIDKKIISKYNLKITAEKLLAIGNQLYFVYLIKHNKCL